MGDRAHLAVHAAPQPVLLAGRADCYSYDAPAWANQSPPIQILNVTFADGSHPARWAVVSDYGGKAEVLDPTETGSTCTSYGGPFCIYPWYTQNTRRVVLSYGVDYPTTAHDFGKVNQFQQQPKCGGPFGPNSTYCVTSRALSDRFSTTTPRPRLRGAVVVGWGSRGSRPCGSCATVTSSRSTRPAGLAVSLAPAEPAVIGLLAHC